MGFLRDVVAEDDCSIFISINQLSLWHGAACMEKSLQRFFFSGRTAQEGLLSGMLRLGECALSDHLLAE